MFELPLEEVQFRGLNQTEFLNTMGVWLKKNYVFIGVRQRYGHYCAISHTAFFRGHTQCVIVKDEDYEKVSKLLKM